MEEYNELVYATAKVVTKLCSPKKERKLNARKKQPWKQKMEKEIVYMRGIIYTDWVREGHKCERKNV